MQQPRQIRFHAAPFLALALLAGCATGAELTAQEPTAEAAPPEVSEARQTQEGRQEQAAESSQAQSTGSEERKPSVIDWPEPPDGKWLTDEDGKRYFIDKVRKVEGRYKRLDDGVVRVRNLMPIRVEREDDDWFYFRVYDVKPLTGPPGVRDKKPSAEELAAAAASYHADLEVVDRLRFETFDSGLPQDGQWRNGFDFADMDGDGRLDLVHGPARKSMGGPAIFLGDGAGNWEVWNEVRWPDVAFEYGDAEADDFDGDGHQDVAFGFHLLGATVLRGDGQGTFRPWNEGIEIKDPGTGTNAFSSREIETADWNGDGLPDLLLLSEGPASLPIEAEAIGASPSGVRIYLNQGDGTWTALDGPRDNVFGDSLRVVDVDGDGRLDFLTGSRAIGYRRVLKLGSDDGSWEVRELDLIRPGGLVWSLADGDFDADGNVDLAVGYWSNELGVTRDGVDVLLRRPGTEAGWERRPLVARERLEEDLDLSYSAVDAGDVDGDGNLDVVAFNARGDGAVFLGDGEGGFVREEAPELEAPPQYRGCTAYEVELVDVDGDGRDEMFVGLAGESGSETLFAASMGRICPAGGALKGWASTTR